MTLKPRKTAQVKQCAVCGPTLGSFVIQGGPEVELRAPAYKKHVSITHNASVSESQGTLRKRKLGGGSRLQCFVVSHSRCEIKPDTYIHIGTLEEQHATNTATESKRSWASVNDVISSPFQQTAKGPFFPPSTDSGNLLGSLRSVTTIGTPAA